MDTEYGWARVCTSHSRRHAAPRSRAGTSPAIGYSIRRRRASGAAAGALGEAGLFYASEEVRAKFRSLVDPVLPAGRPEAIIATVERLAEVETIDERVRLLVVRRGDRLAPSG